MRYFFVILLTQLASCGNAQNQEFFDSVNPIQSEVIKAMTGLIPIDGSSAFVRDRSSFSGRKATAKYLSQLFRENGYEPEEHKYMLSHAMVFPDFFFDPAKGINVYSVLAATIPTDEYVIIGAHYDAVPNSPGAGDNASGVALVISLANLLKSFDTVRFNYIFVLFDQEEDDEIGSRAFADLLREMELTVHSVHITDLSGWNIGNDEIITIQTQNETLQNTYFQAAESLGIQVEFTNGGSSDNKSFISNFRTCGVFGDITEHLHSSTDDYSTIDFKYLASMTELMLQVLISFENGAL